MDNQKLISVIVPVYNVEKYLDRCVRSIVNQTYQNLEIILVDDGSPDNCPAMCDEWAKKDSRIKVIHKINGGLSDARNAGTAIAEGKYISYIDSDDWIAEQMLEQLVCAMENDYSEIASCNVKMIWEDTNREQYFCKNGRCVLTRDEAIRELLYEKKLKQPVWNRLYLTEIVKAIPFPVGKFHEDIFWTFQVVGAAHRVSVIAYEGYNYWQRKGSIMGEGYSLKRLDAIEAYCNQVVYIRKNYPDAEEMAIITLWKNIIYHGQMAVSFLRREEQKRVFQVLTNYQRSFPIPRKAYSNIKSSYTVWLLWARVSLVTVCRVRNRLKIGL